VGEAAVWWERRLCGERGGCVVGEAAVWWERRLCGERGGCVVGEAHAEARAAQVAEQQKASLREAKADDSPKGAEHEAQYILHHNTSLSLSLILCLCLSLARSSTCHTAEGRVHGSG
jgi:hypothetical protein